LRKKEIPVIDPRCNRSVCRESTPAVISLAQKRGEFKTVERTYRLKGDPFDLDALVELFPTIVQNKESTHYLQFSSPDEMRDKEALEVAKDELDQMNAILTLQHGSHRRITIDGITRKDPETGKFITVVRLEGGVEARARSRGELTVRRLKDGVEITAPIPAPTSGETALKLASQNKFLAKALKHFGKEGHTLIGLYNVWEQIKKGNDGQKGVIRKGWASKYEVSRFTGTAQEDRHGEKPANMTAPEMTLPEARAFVLKLLDAWGKELGW
jgi:hypothetical protein